MSKAKKHLRPCPALAREITPAECGEGRGSAYRCPAECPFFPFTPVNYDKHGDIEDRLIHKAYARAARELPAAERESLLRALDASEDETDAMLTNHARFAWLLHGRRDAEGRTLGERWLADKTSGLTNDERVLLARLNEMHPVLIEVHRVVDEQTIEGVDLLTGQPLRIIDYGAAAAALRYAVLFSWLYSMPHYDRISGSALLVPEVPDMTSEEVVREVIRHLGGPADAAGERAWLSEHFARVSAALSAVSVVRWQDAMAAMDARYIKTDYRLRQGADLAARLARRPEVDEETPSDEEVAQGFDHAYVWLSDEPTAEADQLTLPLTAPPKIGKGPVVLGRILLGRERVRVEAMTGAQHQELRARFEGFAAGRLEFIGERADDLGGRTAAGRTGKADVALVPPRLREKPQQIVFATQRIAAAEDGGKPDVLGIFRQQYATFADEPLPALDGQTPRAAAANPALRPRLVALMKSHIRDTDRRRRDEGLDLDLNPLLAELGLQELISEPPPLGFADDELEEDDLDDEAFEELAVLSRGLGPHAVRPPLSERDLERQLKLMHARYPSPEDAGQAVEQIFPDLLDWVFEATRSSLNDNEQAVLDVLVMRACHVLGPAEPPGPGFNFERILRDFAGEFARASKLVLAPKGSDAALERWARDSPQPVVMEDLAGTFFTYLEKLRRKQRPRDEAVLLILACTKAVVAELSRTSPD